MRQAILLAILCILFISGCRSVEHQFQWREHPIAAKHTSKLSDIPLETKVTVSVGEADSNTIVLTSYRRHKYVGSLKDLSQGVVDHLSQELANQDLLSESGTADKSLIITVLSQQAEIGRFVRRVTIKVQVKVGDTSTRTFTIKETTGSDIFVGINGAIQNAVVSIINDKRILKYLGHENL